jgi:hypothetical protein
MNDVSALTVMSMISINIPGFGITILQALMNFVQLDILWCSSWLTPLLVSDEVADIDEPLSLYFSLAGY